MKPSQFLSLLTTAAGGIVATRVLARREAWQPENNQVNICVDFDDAQAAAIRAGLPFEQMLARIAEAGATHLSLPELTLNRLLTLGRLTPYPLLPTPYSPLPAPPVGHWNYLHGPPDLVAHLAAELDTRLPYVAACVQNETTLVFAGNRPTIGEIGLGFEREAAERIAGHGLAVVPRPVSYAWPEKALIERTLADAAELGDLVAFDGEMVLGHEMHLDETLAAMEANQLTFVYFAESRHQKGDWFLAKRLAPRVVLGHQMSPAEMMPLDLHAAAHNWAFLARERGIRFCYLNFFRILHATEPLEGLSYIHHVRHALEDAGFDVGAAVPRPAPPPDRAEMVMVGLAPAGITAAAANQLLDLPEPLALPLTIVAAGSALALPFAEGRLLHRPAAHHHEHSHDHHGHEDHHHDHEHPDLRTLYPPSYAPKLLALASTAMTPVAALAATRHSTAGWLSGLVYQASAASALAALTSDQEYRLRIEEYRGFNLDWLLPLLAAANTIPHPIARIGALATLPIAWAVAYQRGVDPLARFDPGHAEGHTHHISDAMRLLGDIRLALGPQPARKWAGLGPFAYALSLAYRRLERDELASLAAFAGVAGNMLGLVGFRRPERSLAITGRDAGLSFATGVLLGLVMLLSE